MQRYKITVEYDGTDLLGWQKQLDGPSAQEFLEKAVEAFCQEKTEVYGAGRTDAGVHALAQVAHFDLNREVDPFRLREAVNAHLRSMEAPVSVLAAEKTAPDFHARYSAVGRAYIYRITNRRAPLVIDKNRSWPVVVPLDVEKMREGAAYLLGHHDFTSFQVFVFATYSIYPSRHWIFASGDSISTAWLSQFVFFFTAFQSTREPS